MRRIDGRLEEAALMVASPGRVFGASPSARGSEHSGGSADHLRARRFGVRRAGLLRVRVYTTEVFTAFAALLRFQPRRRLGGATSRALGRGRWSCDVLLGDSGLMTTRRSVGVSPMVSDSRRRPRLSRQPGRGDGRRAPLADIGSSKPSGRVRSERPPQALWTPSRTASSCQQSARPHRRTGVWIGTRKRARAALVRLAVQVVMVILFAVQEQDRGCWIDRPVEPVRAAGALLRHRCDVRCCVYWRASVVLCSRGIIVGVGIADRPAPNRSGPAGALLRHSMRRSCRPTPGALGPVAALIWPATTQTDLRCPQEELLL